jgi:hypothetical protein
MVDNDASVAILRELFHAVHGTWALLHVYIDDRPFPQDCKNLLLTFSGFLLCSPFAVVQYLRLPTASELDQSQLIHSILSFSQTATQETMGRLVKMVGAGIGLGREAMAKSPSQGSPSGSAPQQPMDTSSQHHEKGYEYEEDEDDHLENDRAYWELDAAQSNFARPPPTSGNVGVDELAYSFQRRYPPPTYSARPRAQLPCPVILPQRRPENRSRGFVRAYAPVLYDCGIDQATFIDFLDTFDQSIGVSNISICAFFPAFARYREKHLADIYHRPSITRYCQLTLCLSIFEVE